MASTYDTQNIRSVNGANAIVKIGGSQTVLGYATGINVSEVYGLQRIDVLGEAYSRDIEPIGVVVNVSIGFIRMVNATGADSQTGGGAVAKGLVPQTTADSTNAQATKTLTDFFQQGFDLELVDSAAFEGGAPKARYKVIGCRPSSQSFALTRGTLMGINVTCEALRLVELDA